MKRVGLLGLPQSGKSTVFEILLQGAGAASTGAHGREHVGVVRVPDERVDKLSALYKPKKIAYAQVQFVDTAATTVSSGTKPARSEDLFASVRNCDALAAVVADFEPGADPERDLRNLDAELVLNDLALVETRMERLEKELRVGKKEGEREHAVLARCKAALEAERPLRGETFDPAEEKLLRGFQLLTRKPLIVIFNQGEGARAVSAGSSGPGRETVVLKALLEREVLALPPAERDSFRAELAIGGDGLSLVIQACYRVLGLISFLTVGEDEVRAWTVQRGGTAVDAAGEIHSDLAKGFIRAEVTPWERLLEAGSEAKARERGWQRLEGKSYVVQDGDILSIRFNK